MSISSLPFIRTYREISPRITIYIVHFFFIILALFLQAYMHNFNIVYITLFVVLGLAMSSCHFGRLNLKHIAITSQAQGRIYANTPATLLYQISNKGSNPSYDLDVSLTLQQRKIFPQKFEPQAHLDSLQDHTLLKIPYTFDSRGQKRFEGLSILSRFPMLHLKFQRNIDAIKELVVYPQPKGIGLQAYLNEHPDIIGERHDFEGVRRYEPGDMPSLIHWPSLARSGELMSRHFSYQHLSQELHFDFANSGESDEARLSQLTLWVLECEKEQRAFSISLPQTKLESSKESIDAILLALARY